MRALVRILKSSLIQNILKSTLIYTGGNFINRVIPFLMIPILTRLLKPEDYGILATFVAILGIVQIIIYMGTTDAVTRNYFDREKPGFVFPEYVFNAILINLSVFLIIIFFWYLFKDYLIKVIPIPFNYQILIPLLGLFISTYTISSSLLIVMKKPLAYVSLCSLGTLIEFLLSVFFVIFLTLSWKGRVGGIILGRFLLFIIGMVILAKYRFFKFSFNLSYIKDILRYGFPVVLHSLGFVIIAAVDKFFLNKYITLSVTGTYSISYSICSMISFLTGPIAFAIMPFMYEKLANPTAAFKAKLVKYTYLYFIFILIGTFLFIILAPYLMNVLVGKEFLGAKIFVFWLALGFAFHAMYAMPAKYIFYEKKTQLLSLIALFTVILSVVLNYYLIKLNGAMGVAQATCLVFLSRFLLTWYFSNRVYPLPWLSFKNRQY